MGTAVTFNMYLIDNVFKAKTASIVISASVILLHNSRTLSQLIINEMINNSYPAQYILQAVNGFLYVHKYQM